MDCGSDTLDSGADFLTSWLWVPEQVASASVSSPAPSPNEILGQLHMGCGEWKGKAFDCLLLLLSFVNFVTLPCHLPALKYAVLIFVTLLDTCT